jgi:hypothetical protein
MPAPKGNKYATGNNGGRPPLYPDTKEGAIQLSEKITEYFENGIDERKFVIGSGINKTVISVKIPTITGLCLFCGFESRQSFYEYEQRKEFSYTIKKARLQIEKKYEEQLQYGNTVGAIFALKNMDWHDKTEHEHSGKIITVNLGKDDE